MLACHLERAKVVAGNAHRADDLPPGDYRVVLRVSCLTYAGETAAVPDDALGYDAGRGIELGRLRVVRE